MLEAMQYQSNQRQDALNELIDQYASLVKRIAEQIKWKVPESVELDDLIQSGIIGLIEAHNTFLAAHKTSFKTYATLKIRYAIYDALRKHTGISRELSQSIKQVSNALAALQHEQVRPTTSLISQKLGISLHEYACVNEEMSLLQAKSIEDTTENEFIQDFSQNPFVDVANSEIKSIMKKVILNFPKRDQIVLALYYNELLSFKEIGTILDLTEARVSQIHAQLLMKLKTRLQNQYQLVDERG